MSLPPDDVLGAAFHEEEAPDVDAMVVAVMPAAAALREALLSVHLVDLAHSSPEERGRLVALRQALDVAVRDAATIRDAIDNAFRGAASVTGAKQITAGVAGVVKVEQRGDWKVDVPKMRAALAQLVGAGKVTDAELEQIFTEETILKADNRQLNYLAANRGAEVKETIDLHRAYVVNPMSARLTYAKAGK